MLAGDCIDARRGGRARDYRHTHCHCLENLVLRASGDVERRDRQRRPAYVRSDVSYRTGDGDGARLLELAHGERRVRTDDLQLQLRTIEPQQRQRLGTELDHAFLVRIVVHSTDERDRVRIVRLTRRRKKLAIDAIGKPIRRSVHRVAFERLPFRLRRGRTKIELPREALLLRKHFHAFEPVTEIQRKRFVTRVLQPFV